jgi:2-haloacid dehalogenase
MRYEFLLFDADGTLLDFHKGEFEAVREAMTEMGIIPTDDLVYAYSEINNSLWKKLERGEIEKEVLLYHRYELFCEKHGFIADAKAMARRYTMNLAELAYFLDGAEALCEKLSKKFRMYIVTNGVEYTQKNRYKISRLDRFFDGIFISGELGFEKPSREYFDKVANALPGFDKSRTVIVGDSISSDIKGGIGYGIDTVWYSPEGKNAPSDMKITHISNSFDDIYEFLCSDCEGDDE